MGRRGRRKSRGSSSEGETTPAIGNTSAKGLPGTAAAPSRNGVNRERSSTPINAFKGVIATNYAGENFTTYPTFEPIFTGRPKVIGVEYLTASIATLSSGAATVSNVGGTLQSNFRNNFALLLDNIARKYANAQNLTLTTIVDWQNYCTQWFECASAFYGLVCLLNSDGFNEICNQIALTGVTFRARIQTDLDRLRNIPIFPGAWSIIERSVGMFASYVGGDVYMALLNNSSNGTPLDMTLTASWSTIVNQAELQLNTLAGISTGEVGLLRIVISEFFGEPPDIPYSGVKVHRGLYDQFKLRACVFRGATNSFGFPYTQTGTAVADTNQTVSVLIPKGCEKDWWWLQLYRAQVFMWSNNTVLANQQAFGCFVDNPGVTSTIRYYVQGGAGNPPSPIASPLDGFSSPWNENYWAPLCGGVAVNYSQDIRVQSDFTSYAIPLDTMINATMRIQDGLISRRETFGLPAGCEVWSSMKARPSMK